MVPEFTQGVSGELRSSLREFTPSGESTRPLLSVRGLTRTYGLRTAIDGLSFGVTPGEILGFLGPNGAGKTTTFNLLAGLLRPDAGEVCLDGHPIDLSSVALRRRMGVVFQHPSVDGKLTARENLILGGRLYGLSNPRLKERVGFGLELAGLADRADELVEKFSGGMRRRLELSRVLLHDPEIVLLDEPTQGLDVGAARRVWAQLLDANKSRRLTILLTTHSPEEAERCSRLIVLNRGKSIAEGTPDVLRAQVGGEVVRLEGNLPEEMAHALAETFAVIPQVVDGKIVFEPPTGLPVQELVPKVFTALAAFNITSLEVRRASLGDVFLKLTGMTMEGADTLNVGKSPKASSANLGKDA